LKSITKITKQASTSSSFEPQSFQCLPSNLPDKITSHESGSHKSKFTTRQSKRMKYLVIKSHAGPLAARAELDVHVHLQLSGFPHEKLLPQRCFHPIQALQSHHQVLCILCVLCMAASTQASFLSVCSMCYMHGGFIFRSQGLYIAAVAVTVERA
jgi:hypothetical protein